MRKIKSILCVLSVFLLTMSFAFNALVNENFGVAKADSLNSIQDSAIEKIFVGNSLHGDNWTEYPLSYSNGKYKANLPAIYKYIKIHTIRWGLPMNSQFWMLDGKNPDASSTLQNFDDNGNPCTPGSIVYGMREATIWSVPEIVPTSQINIMLSSSNGDKQLLCDINWDGNGGEGPSTAALEVTDADNIKLNGVDATMEYKIENGTWSTCEANKVLSVGQTGISVDVRYAATPESRASKPVTLTENRTEAPNLTFNESTGIISGVDASMEYKVNQGTYTDIAENTLDITGLISTSPTKFSIRYKGNGNLASLNWSIDVQPAEAPAAPTTPFYEMSTKYRIGGYNDAMEISFNGGPYYYWAGATEVNINSRLSETQETTIRVRYRATNGNLASQDKVIVVPAVRLPATDAYFERGGFYVKGLKPYMPFEYKVRIGYPSKLYTVTGTTSASGEARLSTIDASATYYSFRYLPSGGLGYSPWFWANKK